VETLADIWQRNMKYNAERTATVFEGKRTSYAQLGSRALQLGNALAHAGVRKNDRVAILAMNREEWFEVYGASHLYSFIVATVNFRLASPEIAYILGDCTPRVLIFEDNYADLIASIRAQLTTVEHFVCMGQALEWAVGYEDFIATGAPELPASAPQPDHYSSIIYTSGTTGRPKGVLKTQAQNLVGYQRNVIVMGITGADRMALTMPLFHVGATSLGFGAFCVGACVVLHRQFTPETTLQTWQDERITAAHLAPTMLQAVMDVSSIDEYDVASMRIINCAAAPMPITLLRRCVAKFGRIFVNSYGATESAGSILYPHQHHLDGTPEQLRRLGSVGEPFPDSEIRIVDDHGKDQPAGVAGEIILRTKATMEAYWNNHAATVEAIRDGWYYTGDLGYLDQDGFLFLVDRKKDMIVSGGENIYCREVEEAVLEHDGIADVAVIGLPDDKWGEAVKAVVILKPGIIVTEQELIDFCGTRIARYKRPKSVDFVTELPRLPSGKVSKVDLRKRYTA
jgi:acyl-CoA synthetase (AMP-forming)/AMP-acid ligase II